MISLVGPHSSWWFVFYIVIVNWMCSKYTDNIDEFLQFTISRHVMIGRYEIAATARKQSFICSMIIVYTY